ncbi:MAG: phage antirepressor [Pseudomonadota bacterium]
MSSVVPFSFDGAPVRLIDRGGEPWFVAADVARTLGYSKPHDAISRHCKGVRETRTPTKGGEQVVTIIPERDVYRLVMRSKLPAAERFEEWVVGEVLPTIRKTGQYQAQLAVPQSLPEALRLAADEAEKRMAAEAALEAAKPKVAALERLESTDGALSVTDAAKTLKMGRNKLFEWLSANGWIYRRPDTSTWIGYATKIDAGLLEHVTHTYTSSSGTERVTTQVRVTAKGLARLAEVITTAERAGDGDHNG